MAVYIDDARIPFGRMIMCHMIATTERELHEIADAIGMRRAWYQVPPAASVPHYDVSLSRRRMAIDRGAVLVTDRRKFVAIVRRVKSDIIAGRWYIV